MNKVNRLELAEKIVSGWNQANIQYSIVHGLKDYPEKLGRDIDLVIQKDQAVKAISIAKEIALMNGYSTILVRWSSWGLYQIALIDEENCESLPLDLMCTKRIWQSKLINFINQKSFDYICRGDRWNGPFRCSDFGCFIKACLRPLVSGDLRRFAKSYELKGKEEFLLPVEFGVNVNRSTVRKMIGNYGVRLLESNTKEELESLYPQAIYKLQFLWACKNPIKTLLNIFVGVYRQITLRVRNNALVIYLVGNNNHIFNDNRSSFENKLKKKFVELRVFDYEKVTYKRIWKYLTRWRFKPISEFNVSVVIIKNENRKQLSKRSFYNKIFPYFSPDHILEINEKHLDSWERVFTKKIISKIKERWGILC